MVAILDRTLWNTLTRVLDGPIVVRASASVLLAVCVAAAAAVAPVFMARLVDQVAGQTIDSEAVSLAALYLGALCLGRVMGQFQSQLYAVTDQALQRQVSQLTFDHLMRLPMSFHFAARSGALIQTSNQALNGVRILLSLVCSSLLPIFIQIVVILSIVGSRFDMTIWLVVSATVIAYAAAFTSGVRRSIGLTNEALQKQTYLAGELSEGLANVETIKNNTAERRVISAYDSSAVSLELAWRRVISRRLTTGLVVSAIFGVSMAISISLGLDRLEAGRLSTGEFLLLTTYMLQIIGPLEMSGYAIRDLSQGMAYLSGWIKLLAQEAETNLADVGASIYTDHPAPPSIVFENVSLSYGGDRPVLREVSIDAPSGAFVAIVGTTGAGKTSLLRLIQKHAAPDTGQILIDGANISGVQPGLIRCRITCVSQDTALFNASLRQNLAVARYSASDLEMVEALRIARLESLVAGLPAGLDTPVGDRGHKLSGGERQRVAIARAALRGGDILLLDEPTAALDATTEQEICSAIEAIAAGRTAIVVTHRLALASRAHAIFVMRDGSVVERGRHEDLLAMQGQYAQLWNAQSDRSHPACPAAAIRQ